LLITPKALILSRHPETADQFRKALEKAGVRCDAAARPADALLKLGKGRFEAVIVDCEELDDARDVLLAMRRGKSNKTSIAFALVGRREDVKSASDAGAHFVLTKPVTEESIVRCVRAALPLIAREARRYHRQPLDTMARLKFEIGEVHAHVRNLSEGGMETKLFHVPQHAPNGKVKLRLVLPETNAPLDGTGEVAWVREGRLGIKFVQLSTASKENLQRWIERQFERSAVRALSVPARVAARAF
jgi:DNA-binding response OmpR family regulator